MKKSIILSVILYISILSQSQSRVVDITPGTLESVLSGDYAFSALTLRGSMDVRDFACIHDNAMLLTSIDLSGCTIEAYDSRDEQYMGYHTHFEAHTIPPSAFLGFTELVQVQLPANTVAIGNGAFAGCAQLATIEGLEQVMEIGEYAFSGCSALKSFSFPATLQRIGDFAFDKCKALTHIDLSLCECLSYIGKRAFAQNTSLQSVSFSHGVNELGDAAFAACTSLPHIVLASGITRCGTSLFEGCVMLQTADLSQSTLAELPAWTFSGCTALSQVSLPETVQTIGEGAFYYCSMLPAVALPEAVEYLDSFAFAGCSNLTAIDFLPHSLETIGRYAFYHNISAGHVAIPSKTAYIGDCAFEGCVNAHTFRTDREMPAELGEDVFANMSVENKTLSVPVESIVIYEATAQWQDFGTISGNSAVEETVAENRLDVAFDHYRLVVTATQPMTDVRLYNTAGILLAHKTPHNNQVAIETQAFADNIYLLLVTTADGRRAVTKVARVIR